jgi:hypothetical protein
MPDGDRAEHPRKDLKEWSEKNTLIFHPRNMTTPPPLPNAPTRTPKWVVPCIIAAVVLSVVLAYFEVRPRWNEARTRIQQQTRLLSAQNNLIQIGAAADIYFVQEPTKDKVSVAELKKWLSGSLFLKPVEGEDYDSIIVAKGWRSISIQLPSGQTVAWTKK